MVGEMSFKTSVASEVKHHKVRFQSPIYLCNLNRVGMHKPSSYTYDTIFNTAEVVYERRVQISHDIKPNEADRFSVKVAVEQSSIHRFRATMRDIRGRTIQSPLTEMTLFVPRSRKHRIRSAIKPVAKNFLTESGVLPQPGLPPTEKENRPPSP